MVSPIGPVSAEMRLAQLLGDDDLLAQASPVSRAQVPSVSAPPAETKVGFTGNAFEDVLNKTIESLNGVSRSEMYANQLTEKYIHGEVDLSDAMIAQAKMNIATQLAVTTVTSAVNTFKEITQIQM